MEKTEDTLTCWKPRKANSPLPNEFELAAAHQQDLSVYENNEKIMAREFSLLSEQGIHI